MISSNITWYTAPAPPQLLPDGPATLTIVALNNVVLPSATCLLSLFVLALSAGGRMMKTEWMFTGVNLSVVDALNAILLLALRPHRVTDSAGVGHALAYGAVQRWTSPQVCCYVSSYLFVYGHYLSVIALALPVAMWYLHVFHAKLNDVLFKTPLRNVAWMLFTDVASFGVLALAYGDALPPSEEDEEGETEDNEPPPVPNQCCPGVVAANPRMRRAAIVTAVTVVCAYQLIGYCSYRVLKALHHRMHRQAASTDTSWGAKGDLKQQRHHQQRQQQKRDREQYEVTVALVIQSLTPLLSLAPVLLVAVAFTVVGPALQAGPTRLLFSLAFGLNPIIRAPVTIFFIRAYRDAFISMLIVLVDVWKTHKGSVVPLNS